MSDLDSYLPRVSYSIHFGEGIFFYCAIDPDVVIRRYREIAYLIDRKEELGKSNLLRLLPRWFTDSFPTRGYIFRLDHLRQRMSIADADVMIGTRIWPSDIDQWLDKVMEVPFERFHLGYSLSYDGIGKIYLRFPDRRCSTDDLEQALYPCGAAEVITDRSLIR